MNHGSDGIDTYEEAIRPDDMSRRIVSMVHWNPYMLHIGGVKSEGDGGGVRIPYIVGVATLPEYRHQGRMARLLCRGLRREAHRKTPFVWLIPADGAIYEPFSFRYVGKKYVAVWDEVGQSTEEKSICKRLADGGLAEIGLAKAEQAKEKAIKEELPDEVVLSSQDLAIAEFSAAEDEAVASFLNHRLAELADVFALRSAEYIADARAQ
ncbi:MAG: GNAT family N-acetyltransferase, partial [Lachnospiraceae bacterium]|nr:GNAT family N-acetyltransferase [Lachnospiraceae bacterium]